jgi:hypothetical protein
MMCRAALVYPLAHGALNNWGQYAFKFMQDFTVPSPASVQATGFFALYLVGAVLLAFGASRFGRHSLQQPPDLGLHPWRARAGGRRPETGRCASINGSD